MKTPNQTAEAAIKRRAPTTGTLVGTRFQPDLLDAVDRWRRAQPDLPTRPEAVRRLVKKGMAYSETSSGNKQVSAKR